MGACEGMYDHVRAAGHETGLTQDRLYHQCRRPFLFSVPESPVCWMKRMVEHRERYKRQNPFVCGQRGTLWWSDGGSLKEMSNGGVLCSKNAVCKYAGCHRRRWEDVRVYARWRRGCLGEYT